MAEPSFTRHPVEYFGHTYTDNSREAVQHQQSQHCPFLDSECKKPRKSQPEIKVGVCTVGYKAQFLDKFAPVVICPYRYRTAEVFSHIEHHYFPASPDSLTQWAPEVSIGSGGSIDYVLTKSKRGSPSVIEDFLCVEFQAAGTTGTPWEAVLEFQKARRFSKQNYAYGINWANEFAKTMMQQVYKKGMIIGSWQKRIVFVLQDVGLEYLKASYDIAGLRDPANTRDLIQFFTMRMDWDDADNAWVPTPGAIVGSDLEGIRKILAGSGSEEYITLESFVGNINRRLNIS